MTMTPSRPDDTRVFTQEDAPRRKVDITRTIEQVIRGLNVPDMIRVSPVHAPADPVLWVDGERISAAIASLTQNAVEAMPEGGTLTIGVTGDERTVVITVSDTGTGIARDDMDKLFTPFFTTKPAGEGLGLGLPTAYATVKSHGGTITVESNADTSLGQTGTTICITLPRGEPARTETTRVILHEED